MAGWVCAVGVLEVADSECIGANLGIHGGAQSRSLWLSDGNLVGPVVRYVRFQGYEDVTEFRCIMVNGTCSINSGSWF